MNTSRGLNFFLLFTFPVFFLHMKCDSSKRLDLEWFERLCCLQSIKKGPLLMSVMPTREMFVHYYVALEGFLWGWKELDKLQFALRHKTFSIPQTVICKSSIWPCPMKPSVPKTKAILLCKPWRNPETIPSPLCAVSIWWLWSSPC